MAAFVVPIAAIVSSLYISTGIIVMLLLTHHCAPSCTPLAGLRQIEPTGKTLPKRTHVDFAATKFGPETKGRWDVEHCTALAAVPGPAIPKADATIAECQWFNVTGYHRLEARRCRGLQY